MPRTVRRSILALAALSISVAPASAQDARLTEQVDRWAELMNEQVIAWRRDIHANPELGMQEFRTAALVAEHLESLGIEVETGLAMTLIVQISSHITVAVAGVVALWAQGVSVGALWKARHGGIDAT